MCAAAPAHPSARLSLSRASERERERERRTRDSIQLSISREFWPPTKRSCESDRASPFVFGCAVGASAYELPSLRSEMSLQRGGVATRERGGAQFSKGSRLTTEASRLTTARSKKKHRDSRPTCVVLVQKTLADAWRDTFRPCARFRAVFCKNNGHARRRT